MGFGDGPASGRCPRTCGDHFQDRLVTGWTGHCHGGHGPDSAFVERGNTAGNRSFAGSYQRGVVCGVLAGWTDITDEWQGRDNLPVECYTNSPKRFAHTGREFLAMAV